MANCGICTKVTAVSLYIRVKPVWDGKGEKWKADKDQHHFFGFWPPDSHLAKFFEIELQRNQSILEPMFQNNCRGHTFDEIAEAIEQKCPPMSGVPIHMLWNPGSKVTPFLLEETWRQKASAKLAIKNDLRTVTCTTKEEVRNCLSTLLNNAKDVPEQSISLPDRAVIKH